jgi:hypothetical protein
MICLSQVLVYFARCSLLALFKTTSSKSCSNSVPAVPDHKLHGAVDAGIVAAERGIGQVVDLYREIPRILGLMKPLYSELDAAGEVDLRGVGCG